MNFLQSQIDADKEKWGVSEVPTASSVYTPRETPEASPATTFGFDPESKPAPLFACRDSPTEILSESVASSENVASLPSDDSSSTLKPSTYQEKAAKSGVTNLQPPFQSEWRGASGDTALMTPIADINTPNSTTASRQSSMLDKREVSPVEEHPAETLFPAPSPSPLPTPDIEGRKFEVSEPDEEVTTPTAIPHPDQIYKFAEQPRSQHQSRFSWTTAGASHIPETPKRSATDPLTTPEQKQDPRFRSHFSWTTVPTEMSPSQLPAATPERNRQSGTNIDESPMSLPTRERPLTYHESPPRLRVVKRKPTPSMISTSTLAPIPQYLSPASQRSASTVPPNTSKRLPPTPNALSSYDTMTALQAELDTLAVRRFNLDKQVRQLQSIQTAHQDPLVRTLARRREDKERLAKLDMEMSEVRQMEHDVGLKLHRAWKRREQQGSSTALWVRRVTC